MAVTHHTVQRSWYLAEMLRSNGGDWPDLERLLDAVYSDYVRPGDFVIDVGVNHARHLIRLAELVGPQGRVLGIEAVPAFAAYARDLLGTLPHLADRVRIETCAVAAEVGTADFFVTDITDGGLSGLRLRPVIAGDGYRRIVVETRTLDTLIPPDRTARFVKIDIEGGEYDALRAADRLLDQRPLIAFEFDASAPAQFGFAAADFLDLLRSRGYTVADLFGFEIDSGEAMVAAEVWNFVAAPPGVDPVAVTAPGRLLLEQRFPSLAALAPSPPPPPELVEAIRRQGGLDRE